MKTMSKITKKPAIKNLKDLRREKKRLKAEIKKTEVANENSIINKAFSSFNSFTTDQNFASNKIESTLQWLGNKASDRYPMKGLSKIIVSGLIVFLVPIITSKIQDYIKKKI